MFLKCPHCGYLVAIAAARDRCPRCDGLLKSEAGPVAAPAAAAASPSTAAADPAPLDAAVAPPSATGTATAQPVLRPAAPPPTLHTAALRHPEPPVAAAIAAAAEPEAPPPAASEASADASTARDETAPARRSNSSTDVDTAVAAEVVPPQPAQEVPTGHAVEASTEAPPASIDTALPSFAPIAAAPLNAAQRRRRAGAWALALGLSALLGLQLMLATRMELARQAAWRPLLLHTCALLRCSLPDWHQPDAITLLQRDVQPHPRRPELLRITATFRNDAAWPQPWPTLVLSLSGSDGAVVGARAFAPETYLGGKPEQRLLGSGQRASIAFDIRQPAQPAVAFDFTVR